MKREPIFVRALTSEEQQQLQAGLRSTEAVTLRRCQMLLPSAARHTPRQIARQLRCTDQAVRNAIHAFNAEGSGCLRAKSSRPLTVTPLFDAEKCEQLKGLLHTSPRQFQTRICDYYSCALLPHLSK